MKISNKLKMACTFALATMSLIVITTNTSLSACGEGGKDTGLTCSALNVKTTNNIATKYKEKDQELITQMKILLKQKGIDQNKYNQYLSDHSYDDITNDYITKVKTLKEYQNISSDSWKNVIASMRLAGQYENNGKTLKENKEFRLNWLLKSTLSRHNEMKQMGLISATEFFQKLRNGDSFKVVFYQPACPDCANFDNSGFKQYAKQNKNVFIVNIALERQLFEDKSLAPDKIEKDRHYSGIQGTPTYMSIKDGDIKFNMLSEKYTFKQIQALEKKQVASGKTKYTIYLVVAIASATLLFVSIIIVARSKKK